MHPLTIVALLGAASAASAASASPFQGGLVLEGRQTPNGSCATGVHTIAIGGSNSNDPYTLGLLITLATNITAAIPGSDYASLPYDKVQPTPNKLNPGAIPNAVNLLGQYVSEYHAACPDTKIAIIGYSSGAVISSLALCTSFTVPQSLASNTIIAQIEYGSETYNPGLSYDTGTCTNGAGTQPLTDPAACGAYIPLTQSYCDTNDPQCCDGPPQDYEIHFTYPAKYDLMATNFVVSQFNKLGGGSVSKPHGTHPTSSSQASAPPTSSFLSKAPHTAPPVTMPSISAPPSTTAVVSTTSMAPVLSTVSSMPSSMAPMANSSAVTPSSTPVPIGNAANGLTSSNSLVLVLLNTAFIGALVSLGANLL